MAIVWMAASLAGPWASSASAATMPAEGVFENCPLDTAMATCQQRLQVMHAGGVQVVLISASSGSLDSLSSYAATANSLGMGVMWEISNPDWWQQPGDATGMRADYPG